MEGLKYETNDVFNSKVSLWQGDITALEIDCIVNAANSGLMPGGGGNLRSFSLYSYYGAHCSQSLGMSHNYDNFSSLWCYSSFSWKHSG